ncbi:MAG: class I SAM-dependent methyltransferase [Rhodocyclales bacterium]|nr:class I SAM-dependent methyltransferase [Rhodocyclales bacterium]
MADLKQEVRDFWNEASCGERLLLEGLDKSGYLAQMEKRYSLEPYIEGFAEFDRACDQDVLEIGVGLGADHQRFAQEGARLAGIDLTDRAIEHTRRRFDLFGLQSDCTGSDCLDTLLQLRPPFAWQKPVGLQGVT